MSAKDFPVSFGFKAQDGHYYGPSGVVGPFHHGVDYSCPTGTPVVISGVTISHSGATGIVSGAHLHVDKRPVGSPITDRNSFVNPLDWWNITGVVTFAGSAGSAGNMVAIHSGGWEFRFLHNSTLNVKVGDKITPQNGGEMDRADLDAVYAYGPLNRQRGQGEAENVYLGKKAAFVLTDHAKSNEAKIKAQVRADEIRVRDTAIARLTEQTKQMQGVVNELSSRPTKEQLDNAVSSIQVNLKKSDETILKQQSEVEDLRKKLALAESRETVKETDYSWRGIVNWVVNQINQWRKK